VLERDIIDANQSGFILAFAVKFSHSSPQNALAPVTGRPGSKAIWPISYQLLGERIGLADATVIPIRGDLLANAREPLPGGHVMCYDSS
jgi:hypothetical protein